MGRYGTHRPIIIIGHGITGCQIMNLKLSGLIRCISFSEVAQSLKQVEYTSKKSEMSLKDMLVSVSSARLDPNPFFINKNKQSNYVKLQHKLAVRYSNRRR
jgi:hypothetical protein